MEKVWPAEPEIFTIWSKPCVRGKKGETDVSPRRAFDQKGAHTATADNHLSDNKAPRLKERL